MTEVQLQIENLKCNGCARTVKNGVLEVAGVVDAKVDLDQHQVWFAFEGESPEEAVVKKLSSLGYPLKGEVNDLMKKARSYVSCAVGRMGSDD